MFALHWSGGFASHHELVRPVTGYEQMADHEPMASLIETLRDQGRTFTEIADHLNREGFRPAQRAERFHKDIVSRIFRKLRNQRPRAQRSPSGKYSVSTSGLRCRSLTTSRCRRPQFWNGSVAAGFT